MPRKGLPVQIRSHPGSFLCHAPFKLFIRKIKRVFPCALTAGTDRLTYPAPDFSGCQTQTPSLTHASLFYGRRKRCATLTLSPFFLDVEDISPPCAGSDFQVRRNHTTGFLFHRFFDAGQPIVKQLWLFVFVRRGSRSNQFRK